MTNAAPLTIRAVTSLKEFKGLACEWEQLLHSVPGHSVFLTWEWLYYWSKHYLGDGCLKILLAFDDRERVVGIAPFYARRTGIPGLGFNWFREWRFLGSDGVGSSYLDLIASGHHKPALLQSLSRYLFTDARNEWDILTLSDMPAESTTLDLWNEWFGETGKVGEMTATACCPVIRLPGTVDAYRAGLGRNTRYTLQRKTKCLQQAGDIRYRRATSPAEVEAALESLMTLHQQRWTARADGGVFAKEMPKRFHREVVQVLSERGRVSLDWLELEGRPIAAIYGFVYGDTYDFYLPGFDPAAVPRSSPGMLLLHHRIEQAIRDGVKTIDLLQGAQPYKLAWATDLRRLMTLRVYNRSARAVTLKLLESAKQAIKILVR
ncbi:MAG: GNAT family N-acetyltransferase [Nitrospira sp.]|nr:GNAT family N-acetyltransferase [Nitrospira sp.]